MFTFISGRKSNSLICALVLCLCGPKAVFAQSTLRPNIEYSDPAVFAMNVYGTFLPNNTGGAVPAGVYKRVSLYAGSSSGYTNATGASAQFKNPTGMTIDASGNLYVADCYNHRIRKVEPGGVVKAFAGDGYESSFYGRLSDNVTGTSASFNYPTDVAYDSDNNCLYVADKLNDVIRKISLSGTNQVSTLAGTGVAGFKDDANPLSAQFNEPEGVFFVDNSGTSDDYIYVADRTNHRIRRIVINGSTGLAGAVTTVAGTGSTTFANGLTGQATSHATFNQPVQVAVDGNSVYIADFSNHRVRKLDLSTNTVTTLAGSGTAGGANGNGTSATFNQPYGIEVDGAGDIIVSEQAGHRIRRITPLGDVTTLAGTGSPNNTNGVGILAAFSKPQGMVFDANTSLLYIADFDNHRIRKMEVSGYEISPDVGILGFSFDQSTGAFSGSRNVGLTTQSHTITAYNYYGSSSWSFNYKGLSGSPLISMVNPYSQTIGATVVISGSGFNTIQSRNIVRFGNTAATSFSVASESQIYATVPAGATYGPISVVNTESGVTWYDTRLFTPKFTGSLSPTDYGRVASTAPIETESVERKLAAGDFDGDGKQDFVVTNSARGSISVIRNLSTPGGGISNAGSFAAKTDYTVNGSGVTINDIAIGDVDGDGKLDILVADNSNAITIFRNTSTTAGTLSFAKQSIPIVDGRKSLGSIVIGEIDGDGKPDVVVSVAQTSLNAAEPGIVIFRNTSTSGSISFATGVFKAQAKECRAMSLGDLDSDGDNDLVVAHSGTTSSPGSYVYIYRNSSTLSGGLTLNIATGMSTYSRPMDISLADLNRDGKRDITVICSVGQSTQFFTNINTSGSQVTSGSFSTSTAITFNSELKSISVEDLDTDGTPDVILSTGAGLEIWSNRNSTGVTISPLNFDRRTMEFTGAYYEAIPCDVDGDGRPDIVYASTQTMNALNWLSPPPPVITSYSPTSAAVGATVTITGTGFNTTSTNNIVTFGATRATVTASTATSLTVTVPAGATFDLITVTNTITGRTGQSGRPFLPTFNGGGAALNYLQSVNVSSGESGAEYIAIGDLDVDGKPDVVITYPTLAKAKVFRNNSTSGTITGASFDSPIEISAGSSGAGSKRVVISDVDADGKPDLLTGNNLGGKISFIKNVTVSGSLAFNSKVDYLGGGSFGLISGDADGDGRLDIFGTEGSSLDVLLSLRSSDLLTDKRNRLLSFSGGAVKQLSYVDMDGDGKQDFITFDANNKQVRIYRNRLPYGNLHNGYLIDGTSPRMISNNSRAMVDGVVGDVNGDGKPDIVAITDHRPDVYINNSTSGTVTMNAPFTVTGITTAFTPRCVAMGDLNGDGKPDLAMIVENANKVAVLLHTGTGSTVSYAEPQMFDVDATPFGIAIGDIDGDGRPEILTANQTGKSFSVLRYSVSAMPTVTTTAVSQIGETSAVSGGNVTSDGGSTVTARGVVWSTATGPTVALTTKTTDAGTTGSFTSGLTGLIANTTYYLRAYATTSAGTAYGSEVTFKTNSLGGFANINKTYGDANFSLTAPTSNSTGTFSYGISPTTGVASISGNTVTVTGVGSATITAAQAAAGDYASATKSLTLTVGKATTTITLNIPNTSTLAAASNMPISATASNGATVTIALGSGTATGALNGSPGSYTLTGVSTTGNLVFNASTSSTSTHDAGSKSVTMDVTKNNQTITFNTPSPVTYVAGQTETLNATTDATGLTVSFVVVSGPGSIPAGSNVLSINGPGSIVIRASQAGNTTYNPAPSVERTLTVNPALPVVTSFTPTSAGEGTQVTITGQYFTNVTAVSFGGTAATSFTVDSETQITAKVGAGTSGNVAVTAVAGGPVTSSGFTFIPAPTITGFTPTSAGATASVTITGTNLTGATAVGFGGTAATSFTVNSATQITATVAAGTSGAVSVTTPGGTATSAGFTFIPAPASIDFRPTSGASGGTITINGTGLTGATAVTIGGTAVSSFTVNNDNSITATIGAGATGVVSVTAPGGSGSSSSNFIFRPTWTGGNNTDFSNAANWSGGTLPQPGDDILFSATATNDLVLAGSRTVKSVDFNGSGRGLQLGSHILTVEGDIAMPGSITGAGKVIMKGTNLQQILGGGTISNLEIDNTSGVTLDPSNTLTVTGTLTPKNGELNTFDKLTLKSDANGTARVAAGSGTYITGKVTAERYIKQNSNSGGTGRAWRLVSVPVSGTGILRDFFMNGRDGQDLTLSASVADETANSGTPIVGHNYATAADATSAGYDWIGVAHQVSSLRYYSGNASGGTFSSDQVPSLSTSFTNADQGYMVFARGDRKLTFPSTSSSSATTLRSTGTLKTGNQMVSVATASTSKYTLVGNPYMSVLDLSALHGSNSSVIKPSFWIWDANIVGAQKQGAFVNVFKSGSSWVTNTGTYTNPERIESGMAFFVEPVTGLASATDITISESHKATVTAAGMAPFGTSPSDDHGRMFIRLETPDSSGSRQVIDGVLADFHSSFRESLGDMSDREKMRNTISQGALWLKRDAQILSSEGLPWPGTTKSSLPVYMGTIAGQQLILKVDPREMEQGKVKAWLKDHHLRQEIDIDMTKGLDYPFKLTGNASTDSTRFEIVYQSTSTATGGTVTPDDASETPSVQLFPNPSKTGDVKLTLRAMVPGAYTVQVLDMLGREVTTGAISHQAMNGEYRVLKGKRLSPGHYILKLIDADKQLKETLWMIVE